jgi:adenosylcobinamide-GDP ribazoletransferase
MRDLISFLTQLPVKGTVSLERVIAQSYLFPIIGALIGVVVALVAFLAFRVLGAAPDLAAVLTLLGLYLFTGLLHLDGLSDFFDGVMAPGSKEAKRRAMKDDHTGIAGLFATLMLLLLSLAAIKTVGVHRASAAIDWTFSSFYQFAAVFVTAEVAAKLSMNTCVLLGRGYEAPEGLGRLFIQASSARNYLIALLLSVLLALLVTASIQCLTVLMGVLVAGGVTYLAKLKFGAVSGDVIGASNELARCATLLLWALL